MDYNATTPLAPEVRQAMLPFLGEEFGNPSSASHAYGWQAQSAVKKARQQVADLLGCAADEVIFTSGATESNNLAILGLLPSFYQGAQLGTATADTANKTPRPHFITQATEHKAVLEVFDAAAERGAEITILPVGGDGRIRVDDLATALRPNTVLVSIMMANNEIGAIQPLAEIAELCRKNSVILHSDCAQSVGKVPLDLRELSIDMVSISAHKIYGPKGIGALILRRRNRQYDLKPILFGGDQEKGLRPGTLNVAGIVGLGKACALAGEKMEPEQARHRRWQNRILSAVTDGFPEAARAKVLLNGPIPGPNRLSNNLNFFFRDLYPEDLILELSGIAFSSGSACNSAGPKGSHVLQAIGRDDFADGATLRLGLGRFTTEAEVELVTEKLMKMLHRHYGAGS